MNYLLPLEHVLSMHCAANVGPHGDAALFFGFSGTGKTSLSADSHRTLIGDDEHGWSDRGIFNIEHGCYAKRIRLSPEAEPEIFATSRRFGTILENVALDPLTRRLDLDDDSLTENTRGAYPLSAIPNADPAGAAAHPRHVIMLTCDAFGIMPPPRQAHPPAGHVPCCLGLHGQRGRHRARSHRADGHVQRLLRRALYGAAALRLREAPRRADRAAWRLVLAHQYRLDRRAVWAR